MKASRVKCSVLALACITMWGATSVAQAASYLLHQGGFSGGGEINVTFEGVDINGDGLISAWQQEEVSQGFLTFKGNADVRDFASSLTQNELLLAFKVDQSGVDNDQSTFQGVYITVGPDDGNPSDDMAFYGYFGSIGVVPVTEWVGVGHVESFITSDWRFGRSLQSSSPITISQVPEPSTGSLMATALGLGTLVVYGRRQS